MEILSFRWPWNAVIFVSFLFLLDLVLLTIAVYLERRRPQ